MSYRAETANGAIGVCGALGIAFVVLKLCGVIDWSWWWVSAPFWIPLAAGIVVLVAIFTGMAGSAFTRGSLSGRAGTGVGYPPQESTYEPVHGWTRRQLAHYLARNPGYRSAYEAEVERRR